MTSSADARGRGHWLFLATLLLGVLVLVVLRAATSPDARGHGTHEQLGLPPCMMMRFFGVPCPGCGVTTAMSFLVHGDAIAALEVQPFGALLVVLLLLACAFALADHARGRDAWACFRRRARPWMAWSLGAVMLAAWALKFAQLR